MSKEKCRLCLCTTDSRAGVSSSIVDDSFGAIIRNVFPFALPTFDTVGGKKTDLPVLVCFQCSSTIRNFHFFCEHVKANQEKLQPKSNERQQAQKPSTSTWSIDEIIQQIKRVSEMDETSSLNQNAEEHVSLHAADRGFGASFPASETNNEFYESILTPTEPSKCIADGELAKTLDKMDKRVNAVTKQLVFLIQNISNTQRLTNNSLSARRVSFEFELIRSAEALASFNCKLDEKEYKAMVLDWLSINIDAVDSENRMHQSLDLIFHREFFAECNWLGRTTHPIKKIGISNYKNVLQLFKNIGRTNSNIVTDLQLKYFFRKKLNNAKQRIGNIPMRKTSCLVRRKLQTKMSQK